MVKTPLEKISGGFFYFYPFSGRSYQRLPSVGLFIPAFNQFLTNCTPVFYLLIQLYVFEISRYSFAVLSRIQQF